MMKSKQKSRPNKLPPASVQAMIFLSKVVSYVADALFIGNAKRKIRSL
jgi:hypothetical protein